MVTDLDEDTVRRIAVVDHCAQFQFERRGCADSGADAGVQVHKVWHLLRIRHGHVGDLGAAALSPNAR